MARRGAAVTSVRPPATSRKRDARLRTIAASLLLAFSAAGVGAQTRGLQLTYLANMGVLLEGGGKRVVIDGFHHGALAEYASVPQPLLLALEQARTPFERIDLIATTHRHLDHFDAGSVAARLRADTQVVYLAAQETVDSLLARTALPGGFPRAGGVVPPAGGSVGFNAAGLAVEVLDLPHNPTRSTRVANVGFLFTIGGVRVLHVGDADPAPGNFTRHRLAEQRIDVAIVPWWYLTGSSAELRRAIGAKLWVATHVSPRDAASTRREIVSAVSGSMVLTTPGERHAIP